MNAATLFIDRDGTLIEEPADQQVDALGKIRFMPGVFAALAELTRRGRRLVMVSNQDGLGTAAFPASAFQECQDFILEAFRSQGVAFDAVLICPHHAHESCACRKPRTALIDQYLTSHALDPATSAVIGDRDSDLEFARNLGLRGLAVRRHGSPLQTWPAVTRELLQRAFTVHRATRETDIEIRVNLDAPGPHTIATGIGFFDHMLEQLAKHAGFALELRCAGDLHVDEHHTVEDCGIALGQALRGALGDKAGIARFGFLLPMDESRAQVALDLSGRCYARFSGQFSRSAVGALPTELVPHFFRSLAEGLGAALHLDVEGENTHHMVEACFKGTGRALRQAIRREGEDLPSTKGLL